MAVTPNGSALFTPSAQKSTITGAYVDVTTLANIGLQKHDISENLIQKYGNQGLSGYLEQLGAMTSVGSDEFLHFEERMLHEEITLDGTTPITALASNLITAAATFQVANTPAAIAQAGSLRVNAVIQFANGDMAQVTVAATTGARTFTAIPLLSGGWNGWVTEASDPYINTATNTAFKLQKLIVVGIEYAKGTDQPTSLEPLVDKVYGRTAIFKESFAVSGSDASQIAYVKVNDGAGKSGYVWYIKGEGETRKRFMDYCESSLMFGKKNTNSVTGTTGQNGLLTTAAEQGMTDLSGTMLTDARVDAWVDAIDRQRGPAEYTAWCGLDVSLALDDWMASKNQTAAAGEQNWGAFNNSKDMKMNFGFESFSRGGYTFHKKLYDMFNDRGMGGSIGYRKKALFVPSGVQKDPRTGLNIPALQIRYREANGYSRKMEHWFTGSAVLANPTNTSDALNCHYRTERGLQVFGANRYLTASVA